MLTDLVQISHKVERTDDAQGDSLAKCTFQRRSSHTSKKEAEKLSFSGFLFSAFM